MKENLANPHDKFFKSIFTDKDSAREFLSKTIPDEIAKNLDIDSLKLDNTIYVDKNLDEYFADIVYNCNYHENSKKQQIKITILF